MCVHSLSLKKTGRENWGTEWIKRLFSLTELIDRDPDLLMPSLCFCCWVMVPFTGMKTLTVTEIRPQEGIHLTGGTHKPHKETDLQTPCKPIHMQIDAHTDTNIYMLLLSSLIFRKQRSQITYRSRSTPADRQTCNTLCVQTHKHTHTHTDTSVQPCRATQSHWKSLLLASLDFTYSSILLASCT